MSDTDIQNIAKGYRNVYYRNSSSGEGEIVLFGWDKKGNRETFVFPFSPTAKYEVKESTPNKTIFDTSVNIKSFKNTWERKKWLEAASEGINVIEAFRPETEFLMDSFSKYALDDDFNTLPLRVHYLDVEIEVESEFPKPEDAAYPINVITIYDSLKKKYYSWVLRRDIKNTIADKEIILNCFSNEVEMLKDFVGWFSNNYPDVITGWNTYYFDITYIVRRLENVLGPKTAKLMSPSGKYFIKQQQSFFNNTYVMLEGISHLDLKRLYQDKFYIEGALDGGYSLSNVCLHELNEDKMVYDGSIRDFYKRDFQKFFEYNIRDVELTVKLEEKLSLIPLARKITSLGLCQYEQIYGSINYIVGALSVYSILKHNKIFKSYSGDENENTKFEGGYVFPTITGFYKNISCIDFASLYPNTAITLNLSPETKVGQLYNNNDGTYLIKTRTADKTVTKEQLDKLLAQKCILSKNNTLFLKHEIKSGVFAEWCKYFYDTRKIYQKKSKNELNKIGELTEKIKNCKDPAEKKLLKAEKKTAETAKALYHCTQIALKILINSGYGVLGCNFSPIFDIDLAQSITLNGQYTNKSGAAYIRQKFIEKYNCSEDAVITISGDTDSVGGDSILNIKFE